MPRKFCEKKKEKSTRAVFEEPFYWQARQPLQIVREIELEYISALHHHRTPKKLKKKCVSASFKFGPPRSKDLRQQHSAGQGCPTTKNKEEEYLLIDLSKLTWAQLMNIV